MTPAPVRWVMCGLAFETDAVWAGAGHEAPHWGAAPSLHELCMQVSDREHLMARDPAHAAEQLAEATEMMERGDGEEILYRDSGHGPHFQFPELFLAEARLFLDGD